MKIQDKINTTLNTIATARCINLKNSKNVTETEIEIEINNITGYYNAEVYYDVEQNYEENFLEFLLSNIEFLINKDTNLLSTIKNQEENYMSKNEQVYLVANTINGVSKETVIDDYVDYTEVDSEEDFYNLLPLLREGEVIYCLFEIGSELFNKIDNEYGIY